MGIQTESFSKIVRPSSSPCEVYMEHINLDLIRIENKRNFDIVTSLIKLTKYYKMRRFSL